MQGYGKELSSLKDKSQAVEYRLRENALAWIEVQKDYDTVFNADAYRRAQHELTSFGLYAVQLPLYVMFYVQPFMNHPTALQVKRVLLPLTRRGWPGIGLVFLSGVGALWFTIAFFRSIFSMLGAILFGS